MRYATLDDLRAAVPERTLLELSQDDPTAIRAGTLGQEVVERAIGQAEDLIDGYLRNRYAVPLAVVPTVIRDLAVNLARHALYARRPERDLPSAVKATYDSAIASLGLIRDGRISLGLPDGSVQAEPGKIRVRAPKRRFPRVTPGAL